MDPMQTNTRILVFATKLVKCRSTCAHAPNLHITEQYIYLTVTSFHRRVVPKCTQMWLMRLVLRLWASSETEFPVTNLDLVLLKTCYRCLPRKHCSSTPCSFENAILGSMMLYQYHYSQYIMCNPNDQRIDISQHFVVIKLLFSTIHSFYTPLLPEIFHNRDPIRQGEYWDF